MDSIKKLIPSSAAAYALLRRFVRPDYALIGVNRYRFRIKRCRIDVHSGTRLHDVNDDKTNNQRDGKMCIRDRGYIWRRWPD